MKFFEEDILRQYDGSIFSDPATDLIVTAFVNLISTMINNEPNFVSVLLKPSDQEPAIINKLMSVLVKSSPKTQTYFYFQTDAFESICLKFFSRLSVTENGK